MRVIVTCGPSYEPIDKVRRITNFSTGELGVMLAERCARDGAEVACFKGEAATWRDPAAPVRVVHFSTNDDLLAKLRAIERRDDVAYFFHTAALADYSVESVSREDGEVWHGAKIASREGSIVVTLRPATKVIRELRGLFPKAWIAAGNTNWTAPATRRSRRAGVACRGLCSSRGRSSGWFAARAA